MLKSKAIFSWPMSKRSIVLGGGLLVVGALLGLGLAGVGAASSGTARPDSVSGSLRHGKQVVPTPSHSVEAAERSGHVAHPATGHSGAGSSSASCSSSCTPSDEPALDAAAEDARQIAGASYYTGLVVDTGADRVTLYLAGAPQSVLDQLQSAHPGVYVVHNDAPRSRSAVMRVAASIDPSTLKSQGIDVVGWGPTEDGYLRVGVTSDVGTAQERFDAQYGPNIVQVYRGQMGIAW